MRLIVLLFCVPILWMATLPTSAAPTLLVSGYRNGPVLAFDSVTGASQGTLIPAGTAGMTQAGEMAISPNGDLFISEFSQNAIYRFNATTGAFEAKLTNAALAGPRGLVFGSDGLLYVSSANSNQILRIDSQSNAFLGTFASVNTPAGLAFDKGDLFAVSAADNNVVRLDGTTGVSKATLAGDGHLHTPQSLVFAPNGDLLVHSQTDYSIDRLDSDTGAFKSTFYAGSYPFNPSPSMLFFPNGDLYTDNVTGGASGDGVLHFDGQTGAFEGEFIPGDGNFWAAGLVLVPEPTAAALGICCAMRLLQRRKRRARRER